MRAYFFGNMYLSQIQQGIQATHVLGEMCLEHCNSTSEYPGKYLWDWIGFHKTVILLNAGYSSEILSLVDFFDNNKNPYPWASFREGEDALDGALTCTGIILPEKIYESARMIREEPLPSLILINIRDSGKIELFPENQFGIKIPPNQEKITWEFNSWEFKLIQRLNNYRLA